MNNIILIILWSLSTILWSWIIIKRYSQTKSIKQEDTYINGLIEGIGLTISLFNIMIIIQNLL